MREQLYTVEFWDIPKNKPRNLRKLKGIKEKEALLYCSNIMGNKWDVIKITKYKQ